MVKVSIIIPIYQKEAYIASCLQSVMSQTYQGAIECLLIDDCGTDKSMGVAEHLITNYQGPIQFKVLHHTHNRGISAARNTGMEAASGDYYLFLDSDDELSSDCIEKLSMPLSEELYDLVVGNTRTIGNDEMNHALSLKIDDGIVLRRKEIEETYRKKWNMIAVNKLFRADFVNEQELHFKEGIVFEDELWSLQTACLASSLRAVNHYTYYYYVREGSIMTSADLEVRRCKMQKLITTEICVFLKERNIFSKNAYLLMQYFFWSSLKLSYCDVNQFIEDYCSLRQVTQMPLIYRIRACDFHPRAQIKNIYYLLPPRMVAKFIYWHNFKKRKETSILNSDR